MVRRIVRERVIRSWLGGSGQEVIPADAPE